MSLIREQKNGWRERKDKKEENKKTFDARVCGEVRSKRKRQRDDDDDDDHHQRFLDFSFITFALQC